jgi:hypothetical protein
MSGRKKGGIVKVRSYPLSDDDIRKLLGDDIAIHNYPDLEGMRSIDELFDRQGRAILLYPNSGPTSGHWVALINRGDRIEFFDPYGDAPDHQNDNLPTAYLAMLDADRPHLTRLLRESGKAVFYNRHAFQVENKNVATCGRHAVVRLLYAPYSLKRYKQIIDSSGLAPDDFVSGITYDRLRK